MQRSVLVLLTLAAASVAQDHIFPLGFGSAGGPPTASYPVARVKDNDLDGIARVPDELHAFMTGGPTGAPSGTWFMTDGRSVIENGEPAFYFTDSEEGRVIRCQDANHNGVIDSNEYTVFFNFGLTAANAGLFAPDTLGVYRDTATNQTRVYVALDNSAASSLGFTHGIHRLVDLNGDGDAMDVGEESMFVSSTMGLSVPDRAGTGTVPISGDFWRTVRVLPNGKVIAYAQGLRLTATGTSPNFVYTIQPAMNAMWGFTDNNGVAVPEIWFNASDLNNLPKTAEFANGTFPNWDVQEVVVAPAAPKRANYARFVDVVPNGGPNGEPVYYIASSYRTTSEGDQNLNGQSVSGLVYRVLDSNQNGVIDAGELSLWANMSGTAYAGVAPVDYTSYINNVIVPRFNGSTWAMSTATDGSVNFLWDYNSTNDAVISFKDANGNGVIEQGEVNMVHATQTVGSTYPYPYNGTLGPYMGSMVSMADGMLPGPFRTGITTVGDGCYAPMRGLKPVMDAWKGNPQVGNSNFTIGAIRGITYTPTFFVGGVATLPTPIDLSSVGFAAGCNLWINPSAAAILGLANADASGRAMLPLAIPANPVLAGVTLVFQGMSYDPSGPSSIPYYTTNALSIVIQP